MGVTQFTDLTREEFVANVLSTVDTASMIDLGTTDETNSLVASNAPPPSSWDWRAKGAVGPVKNRTCTARSLARRD